MKQLVRVASLVMLVAPFGLASVVGTGCSSDSTTSDGGTSSTSTGTSTGTTPTSTGTGTGTGTPDSSVPSGPELNGCKTYVDLTADAAKREITWGFSVSNTPEACMRIKAGQSVTWNGDFGLHPLGPKGGDTPTPITNTATVKFDKAGTFGFVCTAHSTMQGVILVVP